MMASSTSAAIATRKKTEIWLIGQMPSSLDSVMLPSKREVLAFFFHYKQIANQSIREALHSTANDVFEVWSKARIPVQLKKHVVPKIENIYKEWKKLKKNKENKAKRSDYLKKKEDQWNEGLEELFDIAHANALEMITIQEDKDFLLYQREKIRRGEMGPVDKKMAKLEEVSRKKQKEMNRKRDREEMARKSREEIVALSLSSKGEDNPKEDSITQEDALPGNQDDREPSSSGTPDPKRPRRGRKNILNEKLAANLDVAKLSDRGAVLVLIPALQLLGHDPTEYNVNPASIRRERIKHRKKIPEGLRKEFKPEVPLCIHWDGKLLADITSKVSGVGLQQLLSVPKLPSGTGENAASGVHDVSVAWGINDQVKCICFDTTAANTGPRNGACILPEQKFGKDMLWLACRHHILEIILEAVVLLCLGPSSGPDIPLFKRFQKSLI